MMLERIIRIIKSYLYCFIEKRMTPEKKLDEVIKIMGRQKQKIKAQRTQLYILYKKVQYHLEQEEESAQQWQEKKKYATTIQQEQLIQEAAGRYHECQQAIQPLKQQFDRIKNDINLLQTSYRQLSRKITQLSQERDCLMASLHFTEIRLNTEKIMYQFDHHDIPAATRIIKENMAYLSDKAEAYHELGP